MNLCKATTADAHHFTQGYDLPNKAVGFPLFNSVTLRAPAENPRLIIIIFKCPTITLQSVDCSHPVHHLAK